MRFVTGLLSALVTLCLIKIHGVFSQCDEPTVTSPLKYKDGTGPTYPVAESTSVEFDCDTGYTLDGTNPAVCSSMTLTLPTCSNMKCADPGTLPTGLTYKTSAPTYPIDNGDKVEFECESGYTIGGTNPAACSGVTFTLPTCTATTCTDPGTLSTGLKYKGDAPTYPIDDTTSVEFECEDGYTLGGTNPAVCTAGTLTLPTCTDSASTCADPGTLSAGLKYKDDAPTYPIADTTSVEFECEDGYTLGGTNPAVCTGGTLTLPTCTDDSGSSSITISVFTLLITAVGVLAQ